MSAWPQDRGWRARLNLRFEGRGTRTVLAHRQHEGPLLVQRPFYPEGEADARGGACHAYIIHPPGGVAGGDDLALDVAAHTGAHVLLTTPAAGKFYRKGTARAARMMQTLRVDAAALEWLPQENIFYPDAEATLSTVVQLDRGARFLGWEIGCLGFPARGLSLQQGALQLRFELWRDGGARLIESLALTPEGLETRWGLAGFAVLGTLLASPAATHELDLARRVADDCAEPSLACTLVDGVLACRALSQSTERLRSAFERLWRVLRPPIMGCAAVAPRIWAT